MFASRITRRVQTPSDPPYEVTIRRLSADALEAAQQARLENHLQMLRRVGGADVLRELAAPAATTTITPPPEAVYDRATILRLGIVDWGVPGAPDSERQRLRAEELQDLEGPTAEFLFREILRLSGVAVSPEDRAAEETARKNA